jgi:hypothetical protein
MLFAAIRASETEMTVNVVEMARQLSGLAEYAIRNSIPFVGEIAPYLGSPTDSAGT